MANYYVSAKFGNDDNTGASPKNSFQTIAKAASVVSSLDSVYIYEGKYIEGDISIGRGKMYGIGNVMMDGTIYNKFDIGPEFRHKIYNFNLFNYNFLTYGGNYNPELFKCFIFNCGNSVLGLSNYDECIISTNKTFELKLSSSLATSANLNSCTLYGTGTLNIRGTTWDSLTQNVNINNIIYLTSTIFKDANTTKVKFWHFYSVPIDIEEDALGSILYDNSAGKTINDLRQRCVDYYGGALLDYFPNCQIFDATTTDCFVDETSDVKEGFYLKPTSPSATANYITGKHIGALPVARGLIFPTGYTYGSNIQADGTLLDINDNTPANNTIEYTNPFDHTKVILVENWGEGIVQAMRNGEYNSLDRDTDIDANLLGDTDVLVNDEVYVCEIESLSISDGTTTKNYAVGENCLVETTGTWTITSTLGVMRKLFVENRPTIYSTHSRADATLATANELKYYIHPIDDLGELTSPMCLLDSSGIPVLGDADAGFQYTGHPTYGDAVRVQLRYEKRKSIIQVENAKS